MNFDKCTNYISASSGGHNEVRWNGLRVFLLSGDLEENIIIKSEYIEILGDSTGLKTIFLCIHKKDVFVSLYIQKIIDKLIEEKAFSVSNVSISHLLHDGLIPLPYTIYENIYALGLGDIATLYSHSLSTFEFKVDFPYFREKSAQNSDPTTFFLLNHITSAVDKQIGNNSDAVLMLSSGKDSTALALGAAEAGRKNLCCITYAAGTKNDEDDFAKSLCEKLGLMHKTVRLNFEPKFVRKKFIDFFENSLMPCVDNSQIPYVLCSEHMNGAEIILDGSGSDIYVGHTPSKNDLLKQKFSLQGNAFSQFFQHIVPHQSRLNYFIRTPAEKCFPGSHLRLKETSKFYEGACDTKSYWQNVSLLFKDRDIFDFRAVVRGRYYDQESCMRKARNVADYMGATMLFPWCDKSLINFYFNLPEEFRFDRKHYVNKVLLRKLLSEKLNYDSTIIGKRIFEFDSVRFFCENRSFIEEEVRQCKLWHRATIDKYFSSWIDGVSFDPWLTSCINTLFLFSGWYNHNRATNTVV